MHKNLEPWTREERKCYEQSLMGQSDESVEVQNSARNVDCESWLEDFQGRMKTLSGIGLGTLVQSGK